MRLLSYQDGQEVRVGVLSADGSQVMALPADDMISLIASGSVPPQRAAACRSLRCACWRRSPRRARTCSASAGTTLNISKKASMRGRTWRCRSTRLLHQGTDHGEWALRPDSYDSRISTRLDWEWNSASSSAAAGKTSPKPRP